jgi:hypothetical protein
MAAYHHSEKKIMKISKMSAMAMKYRRKKKIISKLRKIDINIIMAIINGGSRKCGGENRKKWRKWRESNGSSASARRRQSSKGDNGGSRKWRQWRRNGARRSNGGVMKIIGMAKAENIMKYQLSAMVMAAKWRRGENRRLSAKMAAAAQRNGWRHLWRWRRIWRKRRKRRKSKWRK